MKRQRDMQAKSVGGMKRESDQKQRKGNVGRNVWGPTEKGLGW